MAFLPAFVYALLMNALPLVEVIARGRSPSVLLLVTGTIRILVHRRATAKAGHHAAMNTLSDHKAGVEETRRALGDENTYLRGFIGLTAIFTVAHGVFVVLLVFLFRIAGPVSWDDVRIALFYAVAVQVLFLLWDLPRIAGWSFQQLSTTVGQVSLRVLVTQLGLIFGILMAGITGSPWGLVGTFVALRALTDAAIAWLQGLLKHKDLPPGFARFMSRRSKQSVESLEAEFDALKDRGSEVEALLERRIEEVRAAG